MSKTLQQIYTANPITTNVNTDLMYFSQSPYTAGSDAGMTYANFAAQLGSSTPTANKYVQYDSNINVSANNFIPSQNTIISSAGTTILTAASAYEQIITGSTTQIIQEANTSTLALGYTRKIVNNSTGLITVNASNGSLIALVQSGTQLIFTCNSISITSNIAWEFYSVSTYITPSIPDLNITTTGSYSPPLNISTSYFNLSINNVIYNNVRTASFVFLGILGPTTIDFGYVQYIGSLGPVWSNTTSITGSSVFYIGTVVLNTPNLTTFSFPNLIELSGGIALTSTALTTLSFPSVIINGGSLTITASPNLTTISMPVVTYMAALTLTSAPALTSINFTALVTISGIVSGTANLLTTFTLTNLVNMQSNYTLTANALTTLSMPALTNIGGAFTPAGTLLATLNMPLLVSIGGAFSPTLAALTSLTVTNLTTITGAFAPTFATLTTLSLPALATCSAGFAPVCALATTVTLTSLATVTGTVAASFAALATLSFPALVSVSSTFTLTAANLVTFSIGATLKSIGGNFTMTGMKLSQASVDSILVSLAALDGTNGTTAYSSKTINLSGGTSSAPSATGLAAKVILQARTCTVTTN